MGMTRDARRSGTNAEMTMHATDMSAMGTRITG